MTDEKRRCFAFLYASILRPTKSYHNVYDFQTSQYYFYVVTHRSDDNIMVFDYSRGGYMGSMLSNLYDYASASYVYIQRTRPILYGYDYEKGCSIQGEMGTNTVSLYDYETGMSYEYLIT